jgi:hypothetical protein
MVAHSEAFPWPSHYGNFDFFEAQMQTHAKVADLTAQGGGLYDLTRTQGDTLRVFICECYAFGVAEYMETVEKIGRADVVIINSAWCGYTPDAKFHCRNSKIGLFKIGELMGALHRDEYWLYLTEKEKEHFKKKGWL